MQTRKKKFDQIREDNGWTGVRRVVYPQAQLDQSGTLIVTPATLYTLFLPLNDNNGRPLQPDRLDLVQSEIMGYAGGLTQFSPSSGFWINRTAQVYKDLVMPIQTVAPTGPGAEAWFARHVEEMARVLEQQKIFLFCQPVWLVDLSSSPA